MAKKAILTPETTISGFAEKYGRSIHAVRNYLTKHPELTERAPGRKQYRITDPAATHALMSTPPGILTLDDMARGICRKRKAVAYIIRQNPGIATRILSGPHYGCYTGVNMDALLAASLRIQRNKYPQPRPQGIQAPGDIGAWGAEADGE